MTDHRLGSSVPQRYPWVLGVALVAALGAVALADGLIDPSGVYDLEATRWLDPYRSDLGSRTAKADAAREGSYDVLLFGTSRTAVGFDPEAEVWGGARVFNLGLRGSNVLETELLMDVALPRRSPSEIWFVVDLLMFGDGRRVGADFGRSLLNTDQSWIAYHADKLLGLPSVLGSVRTVRNAATDRLGGYSPSGFRRYAYAPGESPRAAFLRWLERFVVNPATYAPFSYDPSRMERFEGMLQRASSTGARVVVVVSPHHATLLELQHRLGLWGSSERFRRDLARLGAEHEVYDATGFVGAPAEPLPADADADGMTWHWEASHFRHELGQRLVEDIRGGVLDDPVLPITRLQPDTIEPHLGALRRQRGQWRTARGADEQVVGALVDCVQRLREADGPAQIVAFGALGNPGCAREL